MIKKKLTGIRLFGILGIVWGIFLLLRTAILLANFLSTCSRIPPDFTFFRLIVIVSPFPPVVPLFGIFFVAAGTGVLKFRAWAHELFIGTGCALLLLTLFVLLIFGLLSGMSGILINIFVGGLILWFFGRDKIRKDFALPGKYLKREKCFCVGYAVVAAVVIAAYSWTVFSMKSQDRFLFARPQNIYYEIKDEHRYSPAYTKRLLLNFSMYLPRSFNLSKLRCDPKVDSIHIGLTSLDDAKIVVSGKPLFEEMLPFGRAFGIDNPYEFGKRVVHARIGAIPLVFKSF